MKPQIHALVIALLSLAAARAQAVCVPPAAPQTDNPRLYLSTFVGTLVELKAAVDRSKELSAAPNPSEIFAAMELARLDYECTLVYVAPYKSSSNETIAASAASLSIAASKLEAVSEVMRQRFRDVLDGQTVKPSVDAEWSGKLEVDGREAWHFEQNAVTAACLSLIEFGPDKKPRLLLTSAERISTRAQIRKDSGDPPGNDKNLTPLMESIVVLRDFLADEKTRPSHGAP
jgi:hypothetical protein